MNKRELAERLAKQAHKSRAKAADDVDSLVYGILKDMRQAAAAVPESKPVEAPKPPSDETSAPKPRKGKI